LSNAAAGVSVAAVALLLIALAATLVIAWRRRRADRASRSIAGTASPGAAAIAPAAPTIASGSATTVPGSAPIGSVQGAFPTTVGPAVSGPPPADLGPWSAPSPLASEAWERTIRHEDDRIARYPHRAAVAIAELDGVDIVVDRGRPAEDDSRERSRTRSSGCARGTDVVVRLGRRRFAVLLVETDERGAERCAHRLRLATDLWLEAVALPLQMRVAVAGPPIGGTLAAALEIAESRLMSERAMLDHEHDRHEASHPMGRRSPGGGP
jgi:GGDEF domain-containing protein